MRSAVSKLSLLFLLGATLSAARECGVHSNPDGATRRSEYLRLTQTYCKVAFEDRNRNFPPYSGTQFLFNDDAEVIFVVNSKVMSTSSKLITYALKHNGTIPTVIPAHRQLDYIQGLHDPDEVKRRMMNYERVMFIRNPYARLYSAWKNKYVDMPSTCKPHTDSFGHTKIRCDPFFDNWVRIGMDIHKYYSLPIPNTPSDVLRGVTWPMFRDAVLAHAISDKHWAAQVFATRMCIFKPTFVAALEHSDDDLQALLDKLGKHNAVASRLTAAQFHANPSKPARILRTAVNYTELYPPGVKEVFDKVFKSDFAAFGYEKDPECA